MNNISYLLK